MDENDLYVSSTHYYLGSTFGNFFPASKKNFKKLFPKKEKELNEYLSKKELNYDSEKDLLNLMDYLQN